VGLLHTRKLGIKYKKPTQAPAARRGCTLPTSASSGRADMALTPRSGYCSNLRADSNQRECNSVCWVSDSLKFNLLVSVDY
jgi:hypothetical protein